jgi:pimeloyl-ACP methyl ester carboxylesterase
MISASPPVASPSRETVVLVHGLAASRSMLWPLERVLRRRGYRTLNWGYRSIRGEIHSLSNALGGELEKLNANPSVGRFHLVTHSMGSILARAALANNDFSRLHRVVMLGPPHGGSRVATHLARVLGWLCRPLAQLSHSPTSLVNSLVEPTGYEIGIIAAARDRVVRIDDTCLSNQADHIVVNSGHTAMLFRREVADLIDSFLRQGRFARQKLRETVNAS